MDWLVLQLADSAFPTGGFAHSGGLEALVQAGEVRDEAGARAVLEQAIVQCAHGALPFVVAAWAGDAIEIDARCDAFLMSEVANRASRTQGRALLDTAARIFSERIAPVRDARWPYRHHAAVFGAVLRGLEAGRDETARIYLWTSVRGLASAAVRLGVLGPHAAQRIVHGLAPSLDAALHDIPPIDDVAWTAPLHELFGAMHDRLYARLFQS